MQLTIKKYESIDMYILLQNNIIIGLYYSREDAESAKDAIEYNIV